MRCYVAIRGILNCYFLAHIKNTAEHFKSHSLCQLHTADPVFRPEWLAQGEKTLSNTHVSHSGDLPDGDPLCEKTCQLVRWRESNKNVC